MRGRVILPQPVRESLVEAVRRYAEDCRRKREARQRLQELRSRLVVPGAAMAALLSLGGLLALAGYQLPGLAVVAVAGSLLMGVVIHAAALAWRMARRM